MEKLKNLLLQHFGQIWLVIPIYKGLSDTAYTLLYLAIIPLAYILRHWVITHNVRERMKEIRKVNRNKNFKTIKISDKGDISLELFDDNKTENSSRRPPP